MKKNQSLYALLLLVAGVLAALGMAAVVVQRQARLRGALNGLPDSDLPARVPISGVNVELTQYDESELTENLDLIVDTGFVWVRQVFDWSEIEHSQGSYDWATYDTLVEETTARNLRLVAVLSNAPAWAASSATAAPDDMATLGAFAEALAERYGDQIDVYQIWDEPNLASGWGDQAADPVGYAAMLEATYTAIHADDADALVLTAGFAPTIEQGPDNLSDVLYLRELYANGAAPFFDGVAGKPYGFDSGPDDRRAHENLLNFSRFILLRKVMEQHGDAHKPLWGSHFGWNSLPTDWAGEPSVWGQVDAETQAAQTIAAYERALTEWPWSGALILDNWQPAGDSSDARWGFALRDQQGELSAVALALGDNAERFNNSLWPGVYGVDTEIVTYKGDWEFSELGADFSENGQSIVDVPFTGDQLAVIARRGDYRAYLYVTVEGVPSNFLPQDNRGAYLVLTAPDYKPVIDVLPVAHGDMTARKTAHMVAERGWDQWALVGYAVGAKVNTAVYDSLIIVLGVLSFASIAAGLSLGRGSGWHSFLKRLNEDITTRLGEGVHLLLALAAGLAAWLGAALTWGGLIPDLARRLGDGPSVLITALTAGVFYFSPWLILTIAALLILFVLIYTRPATGIALIVFFAPFYLLPRELFDRAFSMAEITSLLTFLAWMLHTAADRREKGWPTIRALWQQMTRLDKAVSLFAITAVISLAWADLRGVAFTELRQVIVEPLIVYVVLRTMPFSKQERWRIIDLLVLSGTIVAAVGLYQAATGVNLITAEEGARRLRSVFGSPNNAALFLGRIIPIAAAIALSGSSKQRRWLYGAAGVIMLGAAGLTLSRGGILLGIPAGLGLVAILVWGRTGIIVVVAGVALLGLSIIPLSRLPRFANLIDFSQGSSFFRIQLWQSTFEMLRDRPLTGVGLDQFLYAYRGHYILPSAWQNPDLAHPHNFLLSYWTRLGLLGLTAGVWMQIAFWRTGLWVQSHLRKINDHPERALVIGLLGSMAALIGHGLVDEGFFIIDLAYIFFMTLGLVHQINEEGRHGSSDQQDHAAAG